MFHLFNRVYLCFDHTLEDLTEKIVISNKFSELPFLHQRHNTIFVAPSLKKLVDEHFNADEESFFAYLMAVPYKTPLRIYADPDTFVTIMVKYFAGLMKNLTIDDLYILYRLNMVKFKFHSCQMQNYSVEYRTGFRNLNILTQDEFSAHFSKLLKPITFPTVMKNNVSLEYLLATYLADPSTPLKTILEDRVKKIMWKNFGWELQETKKNLIEGLLDLDLLFPSLSGYLDASSVSLPDVVQIVPELEFINDMDNDGDNIDTLRTKYDINTLMTVWGKYWKLFDEQGEDTTYESFLRKQLNDDTFDLDALISYDMSFTFGSRVFGRSEYAEKMNPFIISFLYRLKRENKNARLSRFSM